MDSAMKAKRWWTSCGGEGVLRQVSCDVGFIFSQNQGLGVHTLWLHQLSIASFRSHNGKMYDLRWLWQERRIHVWSLSRKGNGLARLFKMFGDAYVPLITKGSANEASARNNARKKPF